MKSIKEKLKKGGSLIGTWNTFGSTMATKVIASSGLDFQILDLEHGPFSLSNIHDHVASSKYYDCPCLLRIPDNQKWISLQSLDQGVEGIVFPQIEDASSAKEAVGSLKYFPDGNRGFSPFTFSGEFTNNSVKEFVRNSNENSVSVILLESLDSIKNLPEILKIKELDVVYIGAYDLSKSMGKPGDIFHKKVVSKVEEAADLINKSGKAAGSFVPQNEDQIKFCLDLGLRFITYSVDTFELKNAFIKANKSFRSLTKN
jgi:4-hydroxy-2-oxoheptanedioate aldolase